MNAHWILQLNKFEDREEYTSGAFHCSNCYCIPLTGSQYYPTYEYYCHKCGAHMIEMPTIEIKTLNNDDGVFGWE